MTDTIPYFQRLQLIKRGLLPKEAVAKPRKEIKKVSDKRKKENEEAKERGGDNESDLFFDTMIKRCTGKCFFCNSKTTAVDHNLWKERNEKISDEANERKYERDVQRIKRASVAHLMQKSIFKSIAVHEENWIELCWNCHTMFDGGKITWEFIKDSKEWFVIKEKLLTILPLVAEEERKHKLYSKLINLVYG